ncbi:UDP-glucose dehydrogenase family protein [Salsipaludibacter albus]|uniref:UDP-glucose dehydrogenase family protein n=1 Tax=Salsipaludibacter albus TaxID=2849650 RepID=UPI001EE45CDD|nr:UDP-glucose/GDP-mannose dehydrogenase family protein [Salsipaludibacter albus]MBY5162517.1 UDP-glucose/GDP-mannose dehydrogenase family protein [Salsipaludibacter albus]
MKVAVIGVGHVGLVTAAALAEWGHDVVGMDDDAEKIKTLEAGEVPFHEPGLLELIERNVDAGRLVFTSEAREAIADQEVIFVCVGTPSLPGGGPNLSYVERVGRMVAADATDDVVLVEKSTVPANTGQRLGQIITHEQQRHGQRVQISVASNPEFLREGTAVEDTLHPDRVVYGVSDDLALERLRGVYAHVVEQDGCPVVETDVPTAELIKHASNGFLATRISFMNQVARICERVGADVDVVAEGMGHDARIGPHFLRAGIGYGGSCFPKDVDAFIHLARHVGEDFGILEHVREVNGSMLDLVVTKLRTELWHLDQKVVTILGAAFKPGTDDLREAPAMHLARRLMAEGATVRMYDPVALDGVARELPEVERFDDVRAALTDAHAAVVATEWDEVTALTAADFRELLDYPIVIDGRNVYEPASMRDAGLHYHGIGR